MKSRAPDAMPIREADMTPQELERKRFMQYVVAIGRTVGHDATAAQARRACPVEYAAWRAAYDALVAATSEERCRSTRPGRPEAVSRATVVPCPTD